MKKCRLSLLMWMQVSRSQGRNTLRTTLCGIRVKHLIVVTSVQKHSHERSIFWITFDSTRVSLHIDAASAPNRSPERNTLLITSANTQVRAVGRCSLHGLPTVMFVSNINHSCDFQVIKIILGLWKKIFFYINNARTISLLSKLQHEIIYKALWSPFNLANACWK